MPSDRQGRLRAQAYGYLRQATPLGVAASTAKRGHVLNRQDEAMVCAIPKGVEAAGTETSRPSVTALVTKRSGTCDGQPVRGLHPVLGPERGSVHRRDRARDDRELLGSDEGGTRSRHARHPQCWIERSGLAASGPVRERTDGEPPLIAGTPTVLWYNTPYTTVTRGKMISNEDLAYIAAFIDADGHIGICRQMRSSPTQTFTNPRYQAEVVVTNNDRGVLEWMQSVFGGSIGVRPQVLPHHKPTYRWKVGDKLGAAMCELILPYLRIKHRQAERLIALCDEKAKPRVPGEGKALPAYRVARYEAIYQQFKSLNDDRRPQRPSGVGSDAGGGSKRWSEPDGNIGSRAEQKRLDRGVA